MSSSQPIKIKAWDVSVSIISGMMLGIELASKDDFEDEYEVEWGFCIDLLVIRLMVLRRWFEWVPD